MENARSAVGHVHLREERRQVADGSRAHEQDRGRPLAEVGIDITSESTKPIDPTLLASMTAVVTLGLDASVDPVFGPHFERWDTDEPSERGIDGIQRMRLVRDDIAARVAVLRDRLIADRSEASG